MFEILRIEQRVFKKFNFLATQYCNESCILDILIMLECICILSKVTFYFVAEVYNENWEVLSNQKYCLEIVR